MRLRTFNAPDMPSAMKLVREALGDNAVILSSQAAKGRGITLTAAIDVRDEAPRPAAAKPPSPLQPGSHHLVYEIQSLLRFHNLPEPFISKLVHKAGTREFVSLSALHHISANKDEKPLLRHMLEKILDEFFRYRPLDFSKEPQRIMLVGPPGIGKTLTAAKIATRLAMEKEHFAVITTDNQRAGGIEQLQAFTDILQAPLYTAPTAQELSAQIRALPDDAHVIIDTAGCNPYDVADIRELKKLATQVSLEPVMVLPAGGDSAETIDIVEAFCELPLKRLLVTRCDTARRYGSILSAAAAHALALANLSLSSSIVNSLEAVDGAMLAQLLLQYQSNSQSQSRLQSRQTQV